MMFAQSTSIAVIVPTYNRIETLKRALNSILEQRVLPDEIIVVDDGSTDGTQDYVQSIANVRYLYQNNRGVAAARNTGAAAAKSQWLTFLDSDDIWLPNRIELLLRDLKSARFDCKYHLANTYIDIEGKSENLFRMRKIDMTENEVKIIEKPLYFCMKSSVYCQSFAIERLEFQDICGFDENLVSSEDLKLLATAAIRGAWIVNSTPVSKVCRTPGDTTALGVRYPLSNSEAFLRRAEIIREIISLSSCSEEKNILNRWRSGMIFLAAESEIRNKRRLPISLLISSVLIHDKKFRAAFKIFRIIIRFGFSRKNMIYR